LPDLFERLVGDWRLTRFEFTDPAGGTHSVDMQGRLHYTEGGLMSAHLMSDYAASFAQGARSVFNATSYCGTFRCEGDVVHHVVEISSVRSWVGTTLTRQCIHQDTEMSLIAHNTRFREFTGTAELRWHRI